MNVISSNRMETLVDAFIDLSFSAQRDPFSRSQVIVPQASLGAWIELKIAERLGVCLGYDFTLPAHALAGLSPQAGGEGEDAIDWLCFQALCSAPPSDFAAILGAPFAELKAMRLAQELARNFNEYLLYRGAECLHELQFAPALDGQAQLWRAIQARVRPHRGERLHTLVKALLSGQRSAANVHWHWFASSVLPAPQMQALQALAHAGAQITIYALTPSREYFLDVLKVRGERPDQAVAPLLLANNARRFADLTEALLELNAVQSSERMIDASPSTTLGVLHQRMLDLAQPGALIEADQSVKVGLAVSEIDELIWLKHELIARLDADSSLEPRDILVLTPHIDRYAALIEGVFGAVQNDAPLLPYCVNDRTCDRTQPLIEHFLGMLSIDLGAIEIGDLRDLLAAPSYLQRLRLSADEVCAALELLDQSGFRFGLSAAARASSGLGDFAEHSLSFVLDRLLLGLAGPETALFNGVAPLPSGALSALPFIQAWLIVCADLSRLGSLIDRRTHASEWQALLDQLVLSLYPEPSDQREELRTSLRSELQRAQQALGPQAFGFDALLVALNRLLKDRRFASGSIGGGITFSALVPLRAVPARVVCVLGCNQGEFPRADIETSFNLLRLKPRRGERNVRDDDRHLFLEALLAARDAFIVSAVALNPASGREQALSPLLVDLLADVRACVSNPEAVTTLIAPLSYFQNEFKAASSPLKARPAAIQLSKVVNLSQLDYALKNLPRRYFRPWQELKESDDFESDATRIDGDFRDPLKLKHALFKNPRLGFTEALARGLLALPSDREVFASATDDIALLRAAIPEQSPLALRVTLDGWRLSTNLDVESPHLMTLAYFTRSSANRRLSAWLRHLLLCASTDEPERVVTRLLSVEKTVVLSERFSGVKDASARLAELLALYVRADSELLAFYPAASFEFAKTGDLATAQASMSASNFASGLLDDPYFALSYAQRAAHFAKDVKHFAQLIFEPLKKSLK